LVLPAARSRSDGKLPISCFIIAKNEAHRIARCIASVVDWVDEVIVVEAGSSDDTIKVAMGAGATVLHNDWEGFGQQKRFAEDKCRNTWVLNLDADEVATPEFRSELAAIFRSGQPEFASYWMDVHIVYPGWAKPRLWASDHTCIRFYDRSRVRFRNSAVHDSVEPGDHPVGQLSGVLWHHTFSSLDDLIAKCDERATFSALHSSRRSPAKLYLRSVIEWPLVFVKYYLFRRHFTGGQIGLRYCAIMARYRRKRIVRMIAHTKGQQPDDAPQAKSPDNSSDIEPKLVPTTTAVNVVSKSRRLSVA
jgi:glycosyltransferase involved in cell wall biosynthesis